ncbi:MAG: hypothetical protein H0V06_00130, partial [Gemmatimonadetes bacterium]|nr:hypothetical protein [Gemmatimonadota bacterium]
RNPFQIQVQGRLAVGRQQQGFGGLAGAVTGGGPGGGGPGGGGGGGNFNPSAILDRLLANPVREILALRDTLQLTPEQVAQLEPISDSLQVKLDTVRAVAQRELDRTGAAAGGAQRGNRAAGQEGGQGGVFQAIGPRLQEMRTSSQRALQQAQKVLTPEQWQKVPEQIRSPNRGFGPGGQGTPGGTRGGGGRRGQ